MKFVPRFQGVGIPTLQDSNAVLQKIAFEWAEWAGKEFDTAAVQGAVEEKPEELSEGEPLSINDRSGCDIKDEHISDEVMPAKTFHIKLSDNS